MSIIRQRLGRLGETLASDFLKRNGFTIIGSNLHLKTGEVDILAQDEETIVIIEVKLKTNPRFGHPAEMVHYFKKRKLLLLAREIMLQYLHKQVRIDVVAIDASVKPPVLEHIKNAVTTN